MAALCFLVMAVVSALIVSAVQSYTAVGRCPAGTPVSDCKAEPCAVTQCPRYPNATCVNYYCGGCQARFYVGKKEVTAFCPSSPAVCPDGRRPVQCLLQPCRNKTCPAFPNAKCFDDYCGGCNARFVDNKRDVTKECSVNFCPDGKRIFNCLVAPCDFSSCPRYQNATCVNDYCGGCFARYYNKGTEVTDFCPSSPPVCEDGSRPFQCFVPPCDVTRCQSYPNATCVDDFCGGCNARFYINKTEVTTQCCTSPPLTQCPDEQKVDCFRDPCDPRFTSCDVPKATCFPDYCGGCYDRWFLPDCREVTNNCKSTAT